MRNKPENVNEIHIPSSPPPPPPPWIELPEDVTANILQRLGAEEILESAQKVCSTWWKICKDPAMWRVVHLPSCPRDDDRKFGLMCRCAVDRSQGQMADLCISYFGDDELLNYVALRCSNLRRLALEIPSEISQLALTDAVKKLPQLEALHLIQTPALDAKDVETIGLSCPLLKSFAFEVGWVVDRWNFDDNAVALAIAKSMPNLHHLQLTGDVKNEGLEAILDGCPCLESLDIQECYRLDLKDDRALGERCSKQIKDLRLPLEPSYDDDSDDYYDDGGRDYWNSDDDCDDYYDDGGRDYWNSDDDYYY